ncbi:MAG: thiosulfate oxidation carrier protein SoxY [Cycloclasticus sp.]|nr:thiosulfate oxidation carrier protein SoxY [Cycloclasticus sp.]MBQ0789319.1 thiosulfate oxidation carrier protein SoxY [Cycloclasticus sp.]
MALTRRKFINLLTVGSTACLTLLTPLTSFAAWASDAFNATKIEDAYQNLFGSTELIESDDVVLKVPKIAENGGAVPVSVKTDMKNVESISVFVKDNPQPLTASFELPKGTIADVSTRIKLAQTSTVTAVVKADGKLYSKSQEVKVTIGGCGG